MKVPRWKLSGSFAGSSKYSIYDGPLILLWRRMGLRGCREKDGFVCSAFERLPVNVVRERMCKKWLMVRIDM